MKYALITGLFISSIFAEVNTTKIKVDGMQCSYSCAGKVNSVVQKIDGVKESYVDFAKGVATVTYDNKKVIEIIRQKSYDTEPRGWIGFAGGLVCNE